MRTWQLALILLLPPLSAWAETAEEQGLRIVTEADQRDVGWIDQQASLKMVLRNRQGEESVRENRSQTLEVSGDGDKSLIVFDSPADVKGTAFLSYTHARQPDDQWLYLPALKRVKRISSSNKSGPFMGSEFAYEDISSQEVEKYTYKFLQDDRLDGHDTWLIEFYPQYENSGYTRQKVWVDKEIYRPRKIEFFDRKNDLLKTLVFSEYKQYEGKFWRPGQMDMANHQTGKSTTLYWLEYRFKTGLTDRDFDQNALKRAK
jgi:hypothetical protein